MPYGVLNLNHIIQQKYRKTFLDLANKTKFIPKRKGPESIVYGDKVICVQNEKERCFYKKIRIGITLKVLLQMVKLE